jgi:hypothetical protein
MSFAVSTQLAWDRSNGMQKYGHSNCATVAGSSISKRLVTRLVDVPLSQSLPVLQDGASTRW